MRMTVASSVTLLRLLPLPFMVLLLLHNHRGYALGVLLFVLLADLFDGALARIRHEVTELGQLLDPAIDKVVFLTVFGALVWVGDLPWVSLVPLAVLHAGIFVGAILWLRLGQDRPSARPLGKAASTVLSLGLLSTFFRLPFGPWVVYAGIALSCGAGVDYLTCFLQAWKAHHRSQATSPPEKAGIGLEEGP